MASTLLYLSRNLPTLSLMPASLFLYFSSVPTAACFLKQVSTTSIRLTKDEF
ncbi:uncharacterized protein K460DRAFT_371772 [Cucurbitaria berberidis CBS 394.84]|uniref:Uncharacterized protein n=1 Tax=Cucurbitaria berberidis CBS 394.84 TaxID=1168544 RepID=A0A9P4G7Q7_9PLEO|nr:uncharacterized protein K460DRAFT_371772 [Cucurbitaria berberidis CBS 394.84]KAF1840570.1 hypothetical protein K460DRAFT_371772 [Cucurbitaria berberidis CBS 394.84]